MQPLYTVAPYLDLDRARKEAPDVVEALLRYDPALLIAWDSAATRWVICRANERGVHPQFVYQGEDGGHLPLDTRLIGFLQNCDRWAKAGDANKFAAQEASDLDSHREKIENEFNEEMEYAGRENRRTLARLGGLHRDLFG